MSRAGLEQNGCLPHRPPLTDAEVLSEIWPAVAFQGSLQAGKQVLSPVISDSEERCLGMWRRLRCLSGLRCLSDADTLSNG